MANPLAWSGSLVSAARNTKLAWPSFTVSPACSPSRSSTSGSATSPPFSASANGIAGSSTAVPTSG